MADKSSIVTNDYDRFFAMSLDLLCIAGFDGYFKEVNPSWERTLGWTTEQLTGRPFIEFVHPDDQQATIAEAQRLSGGAVTISFENRYRCRDGSYRWLLWTANGSSEDRLIFAVARDVTEHKDVAQRLERMTAEYRALLDSAAEAIWGVDREGRTSSTTRGRMARPTLLLSVLWLPSHSTANRFTSTPRFCGAKTGRAFRRSIARHLSSSTEKSSAQ